MVFRASTKEIFYQGQGFADYDAAWDAADAALRKDPRWANDCETLQCSTTGRHSRPTMPCDLRLYDGGGRFHPVSIWVREQK